MDTAETYLDIPCKESLDAWAQEAEDGGQRAASVSNRWTFARTANALLEAEGVITTGQITQAVLTRVVNAYKRRRHSGGDGQNSDRSTRSFSIRLRSWCGYAYQMRHLRADHFIRMKLYRAEEDADVPVWGHKYLDAGQACLHAYWDPLRHPEIATTWSREEARVLETRAVAWFALALSTGARRGEMCQLRTSDIDREKKVVRFRALGTKSRRKREVPLSDRVAATLDAMEEARVALALARPKTRGPKPVRGASEQRKPKPKGDWLFRNAWGEQIDGPSTLRQMQRYFAWGRAQGMDLPERFTLHALRHKAISAALQVNPEHARQIAGHQSVLTTQKIYGHTVVDDVRATHAQTDVYDQIMSKPVASAPDPVPSPPALAPRPPRRQRNY